MANWAQLALALALFEPLASGGSGKLLELRGKVFLPPGYRDRVAHVTVSGLNFPYYTQRPTFHNSTFKVGKLEPGAYIVSVAVRGIGEVKQTIEVSPSRADERGRVVVELGMESGKVSYSPGAGRIVSVRQLSIPGKAKALYFRALEKLGRWDVEEAISLL